MSDKAPRSLDDIRKEIDRIDETMHRLLIERAAVIDDLIAIKRTSETGGSAFRPAREVSMMREIVKRHEGILPIDTVESIWRTIISTFTYVQAPYRVHVDVSPGRDGARDTARFHFGFTVPMEMAPDAAGVVQRIMQNPSDLGLIGARRAPAGGPTRGAWWADLVEASAPKIIAALPFVTRPDHPVPDPWFIVAAPVGDAGIHEVVLIAADYDEVEDSFESAAARFAPLGWTLVDFAADGAGNRALLAAAAEPDEDALTIEARRIVPHLQALALVGSHAAAYACEPSA